MLVGALAGGATATVDRSGRVVPEGAGWYLDWWVGADDRWHDPSTEPAVRRHEVEDAPVARTVMRVPGGDATQSIYATAGPGDPTVLEFENASPVPFVVALVVRGARSLASEDGAIVIDGRWRLTSSIPALHWALGTTGSTEVAAVVRSGAASGGPFAARRSRRGDLDAAFLYPVTHRTSRRFVLARGSTTPGVPGAAASLDEVTRGWRSWSEGGLRVGLPDAQLEGMVRRELIQAALRAQARPDAATVAALEDWGFDVEARRGWERLSIRGRRVARRGNQASGRWSAVAEALVVGGPAVLLALRALLVSVTRPTTDGASVRLLAELPPTWLGQSLDVHDAPTPLGPVSYALRWHGARPALLWDVPAGVRVVAPGLDPSWSSTDPRGDALLGAGVPVA